MRGVRGLPMSSRITTQISNDWDVMVIIIEHLFEREKYNTLIIIIIWKQITIIKIKHRTTNRIIVVEFLIW